MGTEGAWNSAIADLNLPHSLNEAGFHPLEPLGTLKNPTTPILVEPFGGSGFDHSAASAIEIANQTNRTVVVRFNGDNVPVKPGSTPTQVEQIWRSILDSPERIAATKAAVLQAQQAAAADLIAAKAEVQQLRSTPPRTGETLISALKKQAGSGDWVVTGVFDLKHPLEIKELAQTYFATSPALALKNLKFAVESGRIATGTEEAWLDAIKQLETKPSAK